jgi:glutamine amidotransferase/cyclase
MPTAYLLDYVAGNVRSLVNAIEKVGYTVEWIRSPEDVKAAEVREEYCGSYAVCLHAE